MKAIKLPHEFTADDKDRKKVSPRYYGMSGMGNQNAWQFLNDMGFVLVDGQCEGWRNTSDNLVLAVPSVPTTNSGGYRAVDVLQAMRAVKLVAADEISYEILEDVPGYDWIVRFEWD